MQANGETLSLSLEVDPPYQESVSSFLIEIGASGTWTEGNQIRAYFDPGRSSARDIEEKLRSFYDRFREEGIILSDAVSVRLRIEPKRDWNLEWKRFFKPLRITPRLVVSPPWETGPGRREGDRVLLIDPGLGFGTGTHPTTRNTLILMDRWFSRQSCPGAARTLDVGSGSGILAIASAALGAEYVLAVEQDGDAFESMRHNIRINGLDRRIRVRLGSILIADRRSFNLVTANITAEELIRISKELGEALLPGGSLIVSGILSERKGEVDAAFTALGLGKKDEKVEQRWVTEEWKSPDQTEDGR
jgi:ribosomal protein L11 methyltransferase